MQVGTTVRSLLTREEYRVFYLPHTHFNGNLVIGVIKQSSEALLHRIPYQGVELPFSRGYWLNVMDIEVLTAQGWVRPVLYDQVDLDTFNARNERTKTFVQKWNSTKVEISRKSSSANNVLRLIPTSDFIQLVHIFGHLGDTALLNYINTRPQAVLEVIHAQIRDYDNRMIRAQEPVNPAGRPWRIANVQAQEVPNPWEVEWNVREEKLPEMKVVKVKPVKEV